LYVVEHLLIARYLLITAIRASWVECVMVDGKPLVMRQREDGLEGEMILKAM